MISTLNKYIAGRIFFGILTAFIVITGIIMLVDFVETSRDIGADYNLSMFALLTITGLHIPQLIEQTIPFAVLFGVMGALFGLNKRSELIVLRASGLSAWRFLRPAIAVTAVIGLVWAMAFNPLAAMSAHNYDKLIHKTTGGGESSFKTEDIWLREGSSSGQLVIHAKSANIDQHMLKDVTFYYLYFGTNGRPTFSTRYDANTAELFKTGHWLLTDVTENEDGQKPQTFTSVSKVTNIDWDTLRSQSQANNKPPFWQIPMAIKKAKQAGFDTTPLILQLHKLLSLPFLLIAMAIIAAGVSLNMSREGGTLKLLITGGALGFGVYFADSVLSAFGGTGALPPILAAWSVPLLVLCFGLIYLSRIEDG